MLFILSTDRRLVGQRLWANTSEWKVSVVESKRKVTEKEGHSLEAWGRPFLLPEDDQDGITASQPNSLTNTEFHILPYTLLENRTFFSPRKLNSNYQTAASEVTQKLHILFNKNCRTNIHIQSSILKYTQLNK